MGEQSRSLKSSGRANNTKRAIRKGLKALKKKSRANNTLKPAKELS